MKFLPSVPTLNHLVGPSITLIYAPDRLHATLLVQLYLIHDIHFISPLEGLKRTLLKYGNFGGIPSFHSAWFVFSDLERLKTTSLYYSGIF